MGKWLHPERSSHVSGVDIASIAPLLSLRFHVDNARRIACSDIATAARWNSTQLLDDTDNPVTASIFPDHVAAKAG